MRASLEISIIGATALLASSLPVRAAGVGTGARWTIELEECAAATVSSSVSSSLESDPCDSSLVLGSGAVVGGFDSSLSRVRGDQRLLLRRVSLT